MPPRLPFRSGFSFTEILFAVVILGIGFIMIAAIFPVAIQQGKVTNDETIAASVARGALSLVGQVANNSDSGETISNAGSISIPYSNSSGGPLFPATGTFNTASSTLQTTGNVWSFRDPGIAAFPQINGSATNVATGTINTATGRTIDEVWNKVSQGLILASDPRYAFVGLYRRDGDPRSRQTWSPFAQVWFIPVTTRSRTIYDANTAAASNSDIGTNYGTQMNLAARVVKVRIDKDPAASYTTQPNQGYILYNYPVASPYSSSSLQTGCFIIIGRDNICSSTNPALLVSNSGRMNGRTYHVGSRRPDLDTSTTSDPDGAAAQAYELAADGDFAPDAGTDSYFGSVDDIYSIGNKVAPTVNGVAMTTAASGPADAYVIGTDSTSTDGGPSQDISAFSTFVKVN